MSEIVVRELHQEQENLKRLVQQMRDDIAHRNHLIEQVRVEMQLNEDRLKEIDDELAPVEMLAKRIISSANIEARYEEVMDEYYDEWTVWTPEQVNKFHETLYNSMLQALQGYDPEATATLYRSKVCEKLRENENED